MTTTVSWRLKRYGRFIPRTAEDASEPWEISSHFPAHLKNNACCQHSLKTYLLYPTLAPDTAELAALICQQVYESKRKEPEIVLTIMDQGYLLVLQGQESLDTFHLTGSPGLMKVQQKADTLMLRFIVKEQSRLIRMQFDGSSREVAIKECSSAEGKLKEYLPASSLDDAPAPLNQPPADISAPPAQAAAVDLEPEIVPGSLTLQHLTQHYLGERSLTLPQLYHQATSDPGDLEPLLRLCLLDPSFHAFVEQVEEEMKKILQE